MQQSPKFKNLKITYSLFFIIICLLLLYLKAFKLYQNSKFTLYDTFTQKSRQTTRISVVKILPFCIPENLSIRRLNGAEQILTALGINHIITLYLKKTFTISMRFKLDAQWRAVIWNESDLLILAPCLSKISTSCKLPCLVAVIKAGSKLLNRCRSVGQL